MPLPQVGGAYGIHTSTTPLALDISAIPTGAWILVTAMSATSTMEITEPAGWTVLHLRETTGTRRNFLFGKIKEASDGSTATFTPSVVANTGYTVVWGTGSLDVASWLVGSSGVRSGSGEPAGARYKNIAPGITTTASDSLVLTISHEATNAYVQPAEVTNVSPVGWTEQYWHGQVAANDRIETAWIGTKAMAAPGATGDVTLTYVSPQDNNGWAIQVAIPGGAPVEYTVPTVIGTPITYTTGATTTGFTINRPSGVADGDYIVVALRSQSSTTTEDPSSPGFTRLSFPLVYSSSGNRVNGFYGRPVVDALTEPTEYTFSVTSSVSGRLVATAFIVRGVDVDNPLAGRFGSYGGSQITGGRKTTEYALDDVPALSLFLGASEFSSPDDHIPLTFPTDYGAVSEVVTSTNLAVSRTYLWVGSRQLETSPAPESSMTWGNPAGYTVDNISLRGTTSTPPPVEGYGLTGLNGSGEEIKMFYTTVDGPRTPSTTVPMRRGFNSVSEALATHGATWAHRGGSVSYPEMSLHAYTQSVARGYGVLEVSLGRTSDGVWFGLHDQSTDRTSGGTYGNASTQTWAQVQAQQIVIGPGGPQPYMRWEEIVAIYGSTHVLVVDPKYALGSFRTEFLNMVLNDVGTDRAIIKFSGSGSGATGLATAAQGMGFETWGFFYAADASAVQGGNGNLQTWGPYWTTIGMEYGASQAVWDEALALGKPVIGHIAPNQTAYNTAMSKGASAVQVSGVGVVNPVSWWTQ